MSVTFWHIARLLLGFALACLVAAATLVLFVYAPADVASLDTDLDGERLSQAAFFALVITPWVGIWAAVPALACAAFAEQHKMAGPMFHAVAGLAIAAAGYFVQYATEAPGGPSIFQAYALIAFLVAGLIGGLVFWAVAGRYAGKATPAAAAKPPAAKAS